VGEATTTEREDWQLLHPRGRRSSLGAKNVMNPAVVGGRTLGEGRSCDEEEEDARRVVFVSSYSKVVMAKAKPWKVSNVEKGTCGRILYHCNDKKVVIWQR